MPLSTASSVEVLETLFSIKNVSTPGLIDCEDEVWRRKQIIFTKKSKELCRSRSSVPRTMIASGKTSASALVLISNMLSPEQNGVADMDASFSAHGCDAHQLLFLLLRARHMDPCFDLAVRCIESCSTLEQATEPA